MDDDDDDEDHDDNYYNLNDHDNESVKRVYIECRHQHNCFTLDSYPVYYGIDLVLI